MIRAPRSINLLQHSRPLCAGSVLLSGLFGGMTVPVAADTIELVAVVRDFKTSHPDFEAYPGYTHDNMVEFELDGAGKPVIREDYLARGEGNRCVTDRNTFNQWFNDVPGVNIAIPVTITLDNHQDGPGGVYTFAREKQQPEPYRYYFPIDNQGWGNSQGPLRWASVGSHNFHFTLEVETEFTYTDPEEREEAMVFGFTGDDDVWVFINGRLAVDIGGVHSQLSESINVDEWADKLGLEPGGTYSLKIFLAERHTSECNVRIETSLTLKPAASVMISPLFD